MRTAIIVLTLLAGAAPGEDISVSRLIERLGHAEYGVREDASRRLGELGERALPALKSALKDPDAEVRRRAGSLIRQIEQRLDSSQLSTPTRVQLLCKSTPLPEAIRQLERKMGFPIKLLGDEAELAKKKLSFDTGEVPFWQALDQLCRSAGLVEDSPVAAPLKPRNGLSMSIVVIRGGRDRTYPTDILRTSPVEILPLTLTAGKPRELPFQLTGAFRITALPPDSKLPFKAAEDGLLLGLEVKVEPRLLSKGIAGLRIRKALDDQGQSLTVLPAPVSTGENRADLAGSVIVGGVPITPRRPDNEPTDPVPVHLKKGTKAAKQLKELSGALVALVQTPPEALVTIDNLMKRSGETIRGAKGGVIKLLEAEQKDGEVRVKFQIEAPPSALDDGSRMAVAATVIINGEDMSAGKTHLNSSHFALLDEKGQSLKVLTATTTGARVGDAVVLELTYEAGEKQSPTKFIYTDRRTSLLEVPFTLRNVPLP